ncbi:MAG TPA: GNAT family N-acetyltransferase [Herpetosiphonaceae bacterium]
MTESETTMPGADATVTLREVTKETVREILRLKVAPEQEQFVASNAVSIAQAYFDRETAWFRGIYADEVPVGFVMLSDDPVKPEYFLWRFMIDKRYQGYGYGRRAIELLIEYVRTRPGAKTLLVSCVPGDGSPCPFYEKLGFVYTGEEDEGELVLRLDL